MSEWTSREQRRFAKLLLPIIKRERRHLITESIFDGDTPEKTKNKVATCEELIKLFNLFLENMLQEEMKEIQQSGHH
jgi:hypothetical protein